MNVRISRTTIVFVVFAILVAGVFIASQVTQNQPPVDLQIAVDPLIEDWVEAAATAFAAENRRTSGGAVINLSVTSMPDVRVWQGRSGWTQESHPDAWIPQSSTSVAYAPTSLQFETQIDSLARTPLLWGGFASRVNALTETGRSPFEWGAVGAAAQAQTWQGLANEDWGNINMAINWPESSMAGVGVLFTAVAYYGQSATVLPEVLSDVNFDLWFSALSDMLRGSERIGEPPPSAMASRGPRVADFGLLPESQWLYNLSGLLQQEPMIFNYPAYQFVLDFPFLGWVDSATTEAQREALTLFGNYLQSDAGQQLAREHGLRPPAGEPDADASLFAAGQPYGIQLAPDYGLVIEPPQRSTAERLIRLLAG